MMCPFRLFQFHARKLVQITDHQRDTRRTSKIGVLSFLVVWVFQIIVDELGFANSDFAEFEGVLRMDYELDILSRLSDARKRLIIILSGLFIKLSLLFFHIISKLS